MATVLIIRFSALGDVAISVPLVRALAANYPDDRFIFLTQPATCALFSSTHPNLQAFPADIRGEYKGLKGLFRLYRRLKHEGIDLVCDLHGVHRSRVISALFAMTIPVFRINKERAARQRLVRRRNKVLKPLMPALDRYRKVLSKAGFEVSDSDLMQTLPPLGQSLENMERKFGKKEGFWLGIAPFARHAGKRYPLEKMENVISHFARDTHFRVFLFGGGAEEVAQLLVWKRRYPTLVWPVAEGLEEEIRLMNSLDAILTMDSANMHLGALANTRVLSLWGATHPLAGFAAFNQPEANRLQVELSCRPCSVYGKKACFRNDYACLNMLEPNQVIAFIKNNLHQ